MLCRVRSPSYLIILLCSRLREGGCGGPGADLAPGHPLGDPPHLHSLCGCAVPQGTELWADGVLTTIFSKKKTTKKNNFFLPCQVLGSHLGVPQPWNEVALELEPGDTVIMDARTIHRGGSLDTEVYFPKKKLPAGSNNRILCH